MKTRRSTGGINSEDGKKGIAALMKLNDSETTVIDANTEADDLKESSVISESASPVKFRKSSRQKKGPIRYQSPTFPVTPSKLPKQSSKSNTPKKSEKNIKKVKGKGKRTQGKKDLMGKKQIGSKMTDYEKMIQKNIDERNAFLASMMKAEGDSFEEEKPVKLTKKKKRRYSSSNDEEIEAQLPKKRKKMAPKKTANFDNEDGEENGRKTAYNTRSRESRLRTCGMYIETGSSEESMTENELAFDTGDDEEYKDETSTRRKTRSWKKKRTTGMVTRQLALLKRQREERKATRNHKNSESNEGESHGNEKIDKDLMENNPSPRKSKDVSQEKFAKVIEEKRDIDDYTISCVNDDGKESRGEENSDSKGTSNVEKNQDVTALGLRKDGTINQINTTNNEGDNGQLVEENKENSIPLEFYEDNLDETLSSKKLH